MINEKPHNGYDFVVLGAGTAGYTAAIRAARLGARTALVEWREVGGTCLNRGCIPTKALIGSIEAMEKAAKSSTFGFSASGVAPDLTGMLDRKNRIVSQTVLGVEKLLQGNGVRLLRGKGVLDSGRRVRVIQADGGEILLDAKAVLVATGSEPARPGRFPFDGKRVMTSDDALRMTDIPESILIVGAGAIGVEFARIFRSLGAEVTLVEMMDQVLPGMDARSAQALSASMRKRGVRIMTRNAVENMEAGTGGVVAALTDGNAVRTEKALVAAGRVPNSSGIGLEAAGVETRRGFVITDESGRTNVPGVYAAGDVAGRWLLAYTAAREGARAAEHALGRTVGGDDPVVPLTVFSDPEVACVGLSEKEAIDKGMDARTGRFYFAALGKAAAIDETEGFVALVEDRTSGRLVGGQIVGPHASDLIAEITLAIRLKASATDVAATLHSHPTLAEAVMEAACDVTGDSIHKLRK
jgi:dihydrolipoamide dehydrogenase